MEELAWVLLENDLWWPGRLQDERKRLLNRRGSSSLRIVSLFGSDERVIVDLSPSAAAAAADLIQYKTDMEGNFLTLYSEQSVSDELREMFSLSLQELNKYADSIAKDSSQSHHPSEDTTDSAQNDLLLTNQSMKRKDALTWEDYFIAVAFLSAMRSKDPSTQVGACIVNNHKRIVGIGYNGFPRGCSDDILPWARSAENELDTKYPYVCHAEVNAILNKNSADLDQCTLYVALFPCNECAKMIIQSGIRCVVYLSDKYHHTNSMIASRRMFNLAGVELIQYIPKLDRIVIDFLAIDLPKKVI